MADNCFGNTVWSVLQVAGLTVKIPPDLSRPTSGGSITQGQYNYEKLGAIVRNPEYVRLLQSYVGGLVARFGITRLRSVKQYFNRSTGNYQPFPVTTNINTLTTKDLFLQVAYQLAVLVFNKAIGSGAKLKVSMIDIFTGEFCVSESTKNKNELMTSMGMPSFGEVISGNRPSNVNRFGRTFTAVDIEATAVFGKVITEVQGLTGISWSIHAEKNSDRRLNERKATTMTKGTQTIAGTLMFALFDESPHRAMSPIQFFHGASPIAPEGGMVDIAETKSVELPAFDLAITMKNEYGGSSTMIIFGLEFTDEGGVLSTRQNENEVTYTYKAIDIEPIVPVSSNNNLTNFFQNTPNGLDLFEKKRRLALAEDMAGRNFEEVYSSAVDNIATKFI